MRYSVLLLSAIISVGGSSYLSAVRPWGMQDQAMISANFSTIITPAGFTFSIWGLIYASWIVLGAYVLYKKIKIKKKSLSLLVAAQILSTLWLIPSQFAQIAWSFVVMIAILALLSLGAMQHDKNTYFSYLQQLFFGWILVASIANLHQTLVYLDWYVFPTVLGVISILVGLGVNMYVLEKYSYKIPSLVFAWACIGIIFAQNNPYIIGAAIGSLIVIPIRLLKHLNDSQ